MTGRVRLGWLAGLFTFLLSATAQAICIPVAEGPVPMRPTFASYRLAAVQPGNVQLTYIGHSSFIIETAAGVTAVTDYNGYIKPPFIPTVVSMNNAHSTHYTDFPEAQIKHVLKGWALAGSVFFSANACIRSSASRTIFRSSPCSASAMSATLKRRRNCKPKAGVSVFRWIL